MVQVQQQLELKLLLALRADEQSLPAESQKKPRAAVGVPFDDDDDDILDDSEVGQHVPKSPTLEDDVFKQNISAVTSTDLDLYEHEDEQVRVSLENPELDSLEEYDMEFYDDEWLETDSCDDNAAIQKLFFFHSPSMSQTEVSGDELIKLDALADPVEMGRLVKMGVLARADDAPAGAKTLSTVYTLCAYVGGEDGLPRKCSLASL